MTQRTRKVESLIQHAVAARLLQVPGAAHLTVTKVDAAPDLRSATVWIGVVAGDNAHAESLFAAAAEARDELQEAVAEQLRTKFVPRITVKRDVGGAYADEITKLIRGL